METVWWPRETDTAIWCCPCRDQTTVLPLSMRQLYSRSRADWQSKELLPNHPCRRRWHVCRLQFLPNDVVLEPTTTAQPRPQVQPALRLKTTVSIPRHG